MQISEKEPRSVEQILAKATGSNGAGADSDARGKPQSGKQREATGSNGDGAEIEDTGTNSIELG